MIIRFKREYLDIFDDIELATYMVAIGLCQRPTNNYISNNNIMYALYGDSKRDQQIRRKHTTALSSLIKKGFIPGRKADNNGYVIDLPSTDDWEYYSSIGSEELQGIYASNYKNKLSMIRVLCGVLLCRSKRTGYKVCDVSVQLLCECCDKSYNTVTRSLETLVELGVLHKATICAHRANVYGLMRDKNAVERYANSNAKRISSNKKKAKSQEVNRDSTEATTNHGASSEATESNVGSIEATYDDVIEIFGYDKGSDMWNKFIREGKFPSIEECKTMV